MSKLSLRPSRQAILWLITGVSLGAIPHFFYQPIWTLFAFASMIIWRVLHEFRGVPLPSKQHQTLKFLHISLAFVMLLLILNSYGTTIGKEAGIALLTVMMSMKVIEIQSQRDFYISIYLGYFLVITNFFNSQSIPVLSLMFIVIVIMTTCLISANVTAAILTRKQEIKLASRMLIQSVPVMLLLFVLFPRIPGPLWGLPDDAQTASTGISDEMTLGNISQLALSDEIAFRVRFENELPPSEQLYWRGPVLTTTDGVNWKPSRLQSNAPKIETEGTPFAYTLTLEPHNNHWLFALDMPIGLPEGVVSRLNSKAILRSEKPVNKRLQYRLNSSTTYLFNADITPDPVHLQLPSTHHARARELAQTWLAQATTNEAYIARVLKHFNQENFFYTLSPPPLQGDVIDSFLFDTKQGFCEHYAASFTVLMRAAGIPARVVTGYLGGEQNPVDGTLVVRQRDAHAWTEIWLENQGWVRIDPTSAVSSERVAQGMSALLPTTRLTPIFINQSDVLTSIWQHLQNNWDAINTAWDLWVLAYGPEKQKELLRLLGMDNPDWKKMTFWLVTITAVVLVILSLLILYRRQPQDKVTVLYNKFCRKLAKLGIERKPSEGPQDYADRAAAIHAPSAQQIQAITALYIQQRYQSQQTAFAALHKAVSQFKPKKIR